MPLLEEYNEELFIDALREKIKIELPFTPRELKDDILSTAMVTSLKDMDRLHPHVIKIYGFDGDENNLLRSYLTEFDVTEFEPYSPELGYDINECHYKVLPWTYEALNKDDAERFFYFNLVKFKAGMAMANIRRSTSLGDIPFDVKGDQFYQECKEGYDSLLSLLSNTSPQAY